jgi:hypothetical protein
MKLGCLFYRAAVDIESDCLEALPEVKRLNANQRCRKVVRKE